MKLIKLSDTHYIVVDDSEIKEGNWIFDSMSGNILQPCAGVREYYRRLKENLPTSKWYKITHSTLIGGLSAMLEVGVRELPLSEVEEVINGYSVEKMAKDAYDNSLSSLSEAVVGVIAFKAGFKAHQELVKDKLFTIKDMERAYYRMETKFKGIPFEEFIKEILLKTEWDIEFVDGKIKLI